jgi:hypothetical protein
MEKYILGNNIIKTTKERYESTFKALGYEPYIEKKEIKLKTKETEFKSKKNKEE